MERWTCGWRCWLRLVLGAASIAFAMSSSAAAQSVVSAEIRGTVTDESGGVLPGVTVQVTSPALQVRQMVAVTEPDGTYRVSGLPIGRYRAEYTVQGFQSLVREDLVLSAGFVARVDVILRLGALQESVTVTQAAPIVDPVSTTVSTTFAKDALIVLPRGRGLLDVYALAAGVSTVGAPDVGDSNLATRRNISSYGVIAQPTLEIEGINTQTAADANGSVVMGGASLEEVQVRAAGNDVEVSVPGVSVVAIMKSGGNNFHGTYSGSFERPGMQGNNLTPEFKKQGLQFTNPLKSFYDVDGDLGGRLIRDRLWFYAGLSQTRLVQGLVGFAKDPGPDRVYLTADDTPSDFESTLTTFSSKTSYQLSKANKIVGVYMRGTKRLPSFGAGRLRPYESTRDQTLPFGVWKGEWQSTPASNVAINVVAGWGGYIAHEHVQSQFDVPGNPSRLDTATSLRTGPAETTTDNPRNRWEDTAALNYFPKRKFLGGSHQLKAGVQLTFQTAADWFYEKASGNYVLMYSGKTPIQIATYNVPVKPDNHMDTVGIFVKDTYTVNRLTLNLGARWDQYHSYYLEQTKPAGQFSSAVTFPALDVLTWKRLMPRLGLAWDVLGTGKTVVKTTFGTYNYSMGDVFAANYNPYALNTTTYRWNDPNGNGDYDPGEVNLDINNGGDFLNIAGGSNAILNPDLKQPITFEYTVGLQHELMANTALNLMYVRKDVRDLYRAANVLRPYELYTDAIMQTDPGPDGVVGTSDDGGPVTIWDYPAAYRSAAFVGNKFLNSPHTETYHTVEATATRRLSGKWSALGSVWVTKNHRWLLPITQNPNEDRFPIDDTWTWQVRANGIYRLPYGLVLSGTLRSQAGQPDQRTVTFRNIPSLGTATLRMEPFGAQRGGTMTVLNTKLSKRFALGRGKQLDINGEVFNLLNSSANVTSAYLSGPAFGYTTVVISPRVARLGAQFSF
jgi:carboxypeptidase family protein